MRKIVLIMGILASFSCKAPKLKSCNDIQLNPNFQFENIADLMNYANPNKIPVKMYILNGVVISKDSLNIFLQKDTLYNIIEVDGLIDASMDVLDGPAESVIVVKTCQKYFFD